MLPELKPRAMGEHLIVPSICSRNVAWTEWPYIRRFVHFLKLLDVVNDAFNVHASHSSSRKRECVNRQDHPFSDKAHATAKQPVPMATPMAGERNQ